MSELPSGERIENIEDLSRADIADRIDKDPEEQKNREEMSDPANREDGAAGSAQREVSVRPQRGQCSRVQSSSCCPHRQFCALWHRARCSSNRASSTSSCSSVVTSLSRRLLLVINGNKPLLPMRANAPICPG